MGMNATAKLFYGAVFDRDLLDEDYDGDRLYDYEEEQQELHCPQPYEEYDKKLDDEKSNPEYAQKWKQWRAKVRKYEKSAVTHLYRGADSYSELCIAIEGSVVRVSWGDYQQIKTLEVQPEWNQKLYDYCAAVGLPKPKLGWYLVAYYG
jgi:hypothetical protein